MSNSQYGTEEAIETRKKEISKEKGQKAAKIRGVGVGSRQKFALAANWTGRNDFRAIQEQ